MSHAEVKIEDLVQIAQEVWGSYLDPEGSSPLMIEPSEGKSEVSASVSVTGAWQGHVVVECSKIASRQAAAALLMMEEPEVSNDDVADALGELANVIGGNVKSLLPSPCALSLPHVVSASRPVTLYPAVTEVCRIAASWLGQPVVISVLESTSELRREGGEGAAAA